jgi:hypothetical protein
MSLFVFGDSWGTPIGIKVRDHFLWGPGTVNYSQVGSCLSQIRHNFFTHLSKIQIGVDSVFFIIPPDIRLWFPQTRPRNGISTRSVYEKNWHRAFKGCTIESISAYFSQVIGSEMLLLQNTCKSLNIEYSMWHNYNSLDFSSEPYMSQLDRSRFVSDVSMSGHLLGYEYDLPPREDGPDILVTNSSENFLRNDPHPSAQGHRTLRSIWLNWLNTVS